MLACPDFTKPFRAFTDASGLVVGDMPCQEQSDQAVRRIAHLGRSLNDSERLYEITEKKFLLCTLGNSVIITYIMFRYNQFASAVDHSAPH